MNRSTIDSLESRRLFAITASFADGVLTVNGDNAANDLAVGRNAGGDLDVNNGAVTITGGAPTLTNTSLIVINGLGGDDVIDASRLLGAMQFTADGGQGPPRSHRQG